MKTTLGSFASLLRARVAGALLAASALFTGTPAPAQSLVAPFNTSYSIADLGSVPGVPTNYGGLTFKLGDANTILIGGHANNADAKIYSIGVLRDPGGHITGFTGTAVFVAEAAGNGAFGGGIDGGLAYGPNGVLFYTVYATNYLGQIKPGSAGPDKLINLGGLAPDFVNGSVGSIAFVPPGMPGAGRCKILSYISSLWYDAQLTPDGSGTFDVAVSPPGGLSIAAANGPEGATFIAPGSPQFPNPTVLITAYGAGAVVAYDVDLNGDPIAPSARTFINGFGGAEGAVVDPVTGDFLFSTYGANNQVIAVRGFVPPPSITPPFIVAAPGVGAASGEVRVFQPGTGVGAGPIRTFSPFPPTIGARVAAGDVTGDGRLDIVVATASQAGHVKVFDGATGQEIRAFFPFGPSYLDGVEVAVADVTGDGRPDLLTATGASDSSVKVFDGKTGAEIRSFIAFPGFLGGVTVASGDVDGDGYADIIVGTASAAGHVKVFSGKDGSLLTSFFAFGPGFLGGVSVAAGDLDGDGKADVIVGSGPPPPAGGSGGNGHVKVFSGVDYSELRSFFAFDGFLGGVRVAAGDLNGDGRADVIVAPGAGGGPHVKVFSGRTGAEITTPFFAFDPSDTSGIFIAVVGGPRALAAETTHAHVLSGTSAELEGLVTPPVGSTPTAAFDYGTDTNYAFHFDAPLTPIPGNDALIAKYLIPAGTLLPNTTYHFRVSATVGPDTVYGADRTFLTGPLNTPPSGGTFQITPTSGNSSTVFTATFPGWTDPDGPITYYEALDPTGSQAFAASVFSTRPFTFPPGTPSGTYLIHGRIYGDAGEYVETPPVTVQFQATPIYNLIYAKSGEVPGADSDPKIQKGALWSGFGTPAVNDRGSVAFIGKWKAPAFKTPVVLKAQSGVGIFLNDFLVVKVGDDVPGLTGVTFKSFKDPVIDGDDNIAFVAGIKGSGVNSTSDTVVVTTGRNSSLEVLAREGDIAPGTGGATFKGFSNVSIKSGTTASFDAGPVGPVGPPPASEGTVFTASLNQGSGTPTTVAATDFGAWWLRASGTEVEKIIREGDAGFFGPGDLVKTFVLLKPIGGSPGFGRGHVNGDTLELFATSTGRHQGLVQFTAASHSTHVTDGASLQSTAIPAATWAKLSLPSFDETGTNLTLLGMLKASPTGVPSARAKGIFQSLDGGDVWEPVVRTGDTASGFSSTAIFSAFKDPVNSLTCADVAFAGTAKNGDATPTTNDGIWFRPDNAGLMLIAREGAHPPGSPTGAKWKSFSSLALPGGEMGPLFTAALQKGVAGAAGPGGITAIDDFGLYTTDYAGVVQEVLRENQPIPGLSKTVKRFAVLKAVAGGAGVTHAFNSFHQIVVQVTFTDNTVALIGIELPASAEEQ